LTLAKETLSAPRDLQLSRAAAIFDVDQTLVHGHTERLFFRYLVRQGVLGVGQALAYLACLALNPRGRFADKSYLAGLGAPEVLRLARRCYREEIAPRVSRPGLACILEHQAQGHVVILLTGSLAFLLRPLQEDLGADWLIASEVGQENGRFTGQLQGLHPRGENKLRLLLDLALSQGLDLSQSYAYGDHLQDLHLFRNIGHPVAVNPSWGLKRQAQRRRWPIRHF
jgi:HAD superfamily hydrolase (TIGR01490 family)